MRMIIHGERLEGCDSLIRMVIEEAAKDCPVDMLIICGARSDEEQAELFASGRTKPGEIVTWTKKSLHCFKSFGRPDAKAVDVAPSPLDWADIPSFILLGEHLKKTANKLGIYWEWGGDWKKKDYVHHQILPS